MTPARELPARDTLVIDARGIAAGRGGHSILSRVDLTVRAGERLALVGENGCGKTTLLRVLAGLDEPLAGTIRWEGRPLPRGADRVRLLGVLFQRELASEFRVRELVTLGLALDGPPTAPERRRVDEVLAWADLSALAERRCATLSGGEAQRATLARALVAGPRLLLLDEPTNHLDPGRQAALLAWLERLRDAVAVVLATHDLALASTCDRVALIHAGTVAALGSPADVLTPDNLALAFGVRVDRVEDPGGGAPLLRVVAPCERRAVT